MPISGCLEFENSTRADLLRALASRGGKGGGDSKGLSAAGQRRPAAQDDSHSGKRDYYLLLALAGAGVAIVSGLVWLSPGSLHAPAAVPVNATAPERLDPVQEFSRSYSRLTDALNAVPQQSPDEVLRAVTTRARDCTFRWSNGQPALFYGRNNSMLNTLKLCADAVESYHPPPVAARRDVKSASSANPPVTR